VTASAALTIRLEPEVEARLMAAARELQRSPETLAGEAIAAWLDLQAWQVAEIEAALAEADAGDLASEAEALAVFRRWGA
jgi:predicted transcriptional regulator